MLHGARASALTLNFVRALIDGGFADLHHPEYWDLGWVGTRRSPTSTSAWSSSDRRVAALHGDAVRAVEVHNLNRVDFYTSHEAAAALRAGADAPGAAPRGWYNLSTHFPWIGMRTAQLDGAHVEYFRGIRNPLGIKIGPAMTAEWLLGLLDVLDPETSRAASRSSTAWARQHRVEAAAAGRGGARHRPHRAVGLRSDARQHRDDAERLQDAPLRQHPSASSSRRSSCTLAGGAPGRRALRAHRRGRHRVHRRRAA